MSFTSNTIVNRDAGTSEFRYRVNGNEERVLTLGEQGIFHLPPVSLAGPMRLDDFTEIVNGVQRWQERTRAELKFVAATPGMIEDVTFSIGAQGADGTYATSSSVSITGNGTMAFVYTPGSGVEFVPRGAVDLRWVDMQTRNALSFDMITAALTGQRPRPGASIMGPRGETGATGPAGPEGPPAPYRQRQISLTWTNVNANLVADSPLSIPFGLWRIDGLMAYSGSIDLSTVARIGLYTGPAATGTALVVPTLLALPLGENNGYNPAAAAQRTSRGEPVVYLRVTTPKGSASTFSAMLTLTDLST